MVEKQTQQVVRSSCLRLVLVYQRCTWMPHCILVHSYLTQEFRTCYGGVLSDFHSRLMQRRDVLELPAIGMGTNRLFKDEHCQANL